MKWETRVRLEPETEPPEGYVFGHTEYDHTTHEVYALWIKESLVDGSAFAHKRESVWIKTNTIMQRRYVGEWRDV